MSSSTFTVFRDDVSSPRHKRTASGSEIATRASTNRARSNTVSSSTPTRSPLSPATFGVTRRDSLMNKENLDPETGERALSLAAREKSAKGAKKTKAPRKAGVLQAKTVSARTITLDDENAGSIATSSSSRGPTASDASTTPATRSRKRARTATLPSVIEEDVIADLASDIDSLRVDTHVASAWTDADIRCYELTVSPLADISPAFESAFHRPEGPSQRTFRKVSAQPLYVIEHVLI